jgi:uncharacterized membrane protein
MTLATSPAAGHAAPAPSPVPIQFRKMSIADIKDALWEGWEDLRNSRTDALLIAAIFPLAGVIFAAAFIVQALLPFIFPILSGFALLGPLATLYFAALSRQSERGDESISLIFSEPRIIHIQRLAGIAILIFFSWNMSAAIIYLLTLGSSNADAGAPFLQRVFTTPAGIELIVIGCAVGAVFAFVTLCISVISFPVIIDRDVTAFQAIGISVQAMRHNPVFVLAWGAVVAGSLVFGAVTFLLGMCVVLPVLGHATWHVYKKMTY